MLVGDCAFPPTAYPTSFAGQPIVGWCVYIPGGDAYHGWTQAEIDHLKAQPWCRYLLPVFVRSNPQGAAQAVADAATVAAWARAQGQPRATLTMLDFETAVDSAYELAFDQSLRGADGDLEVLYGSKSTVTRNTAPSGGYDEADWTGSVPGAPASTATQFYSGTAYDLSDFRDTAQLWDIRPAATPAPATPEEDDMATTSVNGRAGLSWAAGTRHVVQVTYDPAGGDPALRVVFALTSGPVVLSLSPARGTGELQIPTQYIPNCRGVILELQPGSPDVVYDACAV